MTLQLEIRPGGLTLGDLRGIDREGAEVMLGAEARAAIRASKQVLDRAIEDRRAIYGVTTGAGPPVCPERPCGACGACDTCFGAGVFAGAKAAAR